MELAAFSPCFRSSYCSSIVTATPLRVGRFGPPVDAQVVGSQFSSCSCLCLDCCEVFRQTLLCTLMRRWHVFFVLPFFPCCAVLVCMRGPWRPRALACVQFEVCPGSPICHAVVVARLVELRLLLHGGMFAWRFCLPTASYPLINTTESANAILFSFQAVDRQASLSSKLYPTSAPVPCMLRAS